MSSKGVSKEATDFFTLGGKVLTPEERRDEDVAERVSFHSQEAVCRYLFPCCVLIPVEAAYLPVKGLQQLIKTIGRVHRKLNPSLTIMGILLTKVDRRTNFARDISAQIREVYGNRVHIFENCIPLWLLYRIQNSSDYPYHSIAIPKV